ncbi:hypothetical protein, partial [Klebsiella pneumoniae]|uniref:hypothetical protein n=1 Tax=Klebsiella pneumoniae TaxID=573 RepID=UPI001CC2143E
IKKIVRPNKKIFELTRPAIMNSPKAMRYEYLITVVGFSLSMYHPIIVAPITPPKGKIAAI